MSRFGLDGGVFLLGLLTGCTLGPCGAGCADDGRIESEVRAALAREPALGAPNQVDVQTRRRIVYLTGLVDTPFEQQLAESIARSVPGVARVSDAIGLSGNAR